MTPVRTTRRDLIAAALALPALAGSSTRTAAARDLKISHQFAGGTDDEGDFRDRLCRRFAGEIARRSGGALTATVYPSAALMKINAQFAALRKGALDLRRAQPEERARGGAVPTRRDRGWWQAAHPPCHRRRRPPGHGEAGQGRGLRR